MASPFALAIIFGLPLVEIAGFVLVGSRIGALATIGLVVATTALGAILLRIQGFGAMTRIRAAMERGEPPGRELVHGAMIMVAGLLLLAPGFFTDALGLLLFIPPLRELAWRAMKGRIVAFDLSAARRRRAPGTARTIDLDEDEFTRRPDPDREKPTIRDDR